jgi:hypothetical protein
VIVSIQVVDLQKVMINVLHADLSGHPIDADGFQRQHGESAGGVLRERLIDVKGDRRAHVHRAADEVRRDQFLGNILLPI